MTRRRDFLIGMGALPLDAVLLIVGGVIGAQIGTQLGAKLRAEQLRILLALLVLAVCGKLALDLFLRPDDLYSLTPGILR